MKDRSVALILAVFLSFITWTYTYARNKSKFWVGLALTLLGNAVLFGAPVVGVLLLIGVWLWAVIDTASKPTDYDLRFPDPYIN